MLGENRRLRTAVAAGTGESLRLRDALVAKDTVIATADRRITGLGMLERDAQVRGAQWKAKAKSRWWLLVGETALLLGLTTLAVTR